MWSNKQPWWAKKAEENKADNSYRKNWCVIKVSVGLKHIPNQWEPAYIYKYKAVAKANAPKIYSASGVLLQQKEVDNLTKQEAHEVAKGLNFLDGELNA